MKPNIQLKKSSMAFELKNGEILLISKEDINEIATNLIVEMMVNNQNHVYIHKDKSIEKANLLYKIITEQAGKISKKLRNQYMENIVKLIEDSRGEMVPMSEINSQ